MSTLSLLYIYIYLLSLHLGHIFVLVFHTLIASSIEFTDSSLLLNQTIVLLFSNKSNRPLSLF